MTRGQTLPDTLTTLLRCPREGCALSPDGDVLLCRACGAAYACAEGRVFFIPPPEDIRTSAALKVEARNPQSWTVWRKSNHAFFEHALRSINPTAVVVDLGVGDAQFTDLLSRFRTVIGIDFSPYRDAHVVCDITKQLPLQGACCDVVFASNVFEHIPYPLDVLRECIRILKPGGTIVGTTPFLLDVHQAPYDFNRYTNFMLDRLLTDAGFQDISVTGLGTPYDALRNMQLHYFYKVLKANQRNRLSRYLAKLLWNLLKIINLVMRKFLPLPPTSEYTQGYGFSANK